MLKYLLSKTIGFSKLYQNAADTIFDTMNLQH